MTNNDFKQLLEASFKPVNERLDQLQKGQEEFREDLKAVKTDLNGVKEDLNGVKEDLKAVKTDLNGVKEDLNNLKQLVEERVLPPLIYIETTIKGYADMYKINDSNIRRMEKRLETVEENAGIDVPPELRLEPLSEPLTEAI